MDTSDKQFFTVINGQLHEITVDEVDKVNWSATITCKYTKPFYRWDSAIDDYGWLASGWVSLSDILHFDAGSTMLRVVPIEADRLAGLGIPVEFHANTVAPQPAV